MIYCAMIKSNQEYLSKINKNKILEKKTETQSINEKKEKEKDISEKVKEKNNSNNNQDNKEFENEEQNNNTINTIQTEQGAVTGNDAIEETNVNRNKGNKDEEENKNKEKDMFAKDEEYARKLNEELNNQGNNENKKKYRKKADVKLIENENISKNVLKLIYNIIHVLAKIEFRKNTKESRFLFSILLKFTFITPDAKKFLNENLQLSTIFNLIYCQECKQQNYSLEKLFDIDKGFFEPSHNILNPNLNDQVYGENDKTGKFVDINYDFMLLCSLMYYKERPKDDIIKKDEDIGFTFWNEDYIYRLIRKSKTLQDINYLSSLIKLKCIDNKDIFDNVLNKLLYILERINDDENAFYDEFDKDSTYNIYKNKNVTSAISNILNLLRSNVTIIFKKLFHETKDKFDDYKIKTCLNKLFALFCKYKKYYGISISIINIIIDIYEERNIYNQYPKEITEILNWLNKNKVPPKLYSIKGISMYRDEQMNFYYQGEISKDVKKEFEQVETQKANKKIEYINKILKEKNNSYDTSNFYGDLSEFKFTFGDKVIFDNKICRVTNFLDELIKVKLIEDKKEEEYEKEFKVKNIFKKKKDIYEKEKNSFWVETDDYRLKIKDLVKTKL